MCASGGQLIMFFIVIPLALSAGAVGVFIWTLTVLRRRQEERSGRVWSPERGFEGEEPGV